MAMRGKLLFPLVASLFVVAPLLIPPLRAHSEAGVAFQLERLL